MKLEKAVWPVWIGLAVFLCASAFGLHIFSGQFGADDLLIDMPVVEFVAGYFVVCLIFWCTAPAIIGKTAPFATRNVFMLIFALGFIARLAFIGSTPVMENDHNRYLWDGAVVANGLNPYAQTPDDIFETAKPGEILYQLQEQSGPVFDRINHPQFSTVYPPIAQGAFALSYLLSPFSLDAWRIVLLLFEIGTLGLITLILQQLGKSPLWAALYWLNPLVIKEAANSAHMEPLLMLPVMAAVWLTLANRHARATIVLTIAAGVKIWPMLLALPLWRQMLAGPKRMIVNMAVCGIILLTLLFPILLAGLSPKSGFVAFAGQWNSSSAFYLIMLELVSPLANLMDLETLDAPRLTRLVLGVMLLSICGTLCWHRASGNEAVMKRMFLITVAIYLLAPSHTPWYFLWIAPFLCIYPNRGLLLAGVTLTLHYAYFYYLPRDLGETYQFGIVWLIWLPVWLLMGFDLLKDRNREPAHA